MRKVHLQSHVRAARSHFAENLFGPNPQPPTISDLLKSTRLHTSNMSTPSSVSTTTNKKKSVWSDLPRRLATIGIGFPLVWKMLSQPISALIFFMGAHALATWEYTLLEPKSIGATHAASMPSSPAPSTSSRLGFCLASLLLAHVTSDSLFHLLTCCLTGIFVWTKRQHWILGLVVVTIPFRAWYVLSQEDFASTISVLLVVWNCDTGALLFGRLFSSTSKLIGMRRMPVPTWIHTISPAKSMEGFVGGMLGGTWTAVSWIPFLVRMFSIETSSAFDNLWTPLSYRILLGISLSFLAIGGDLVESAIKRQSQSKDSGSFLPGHGGILDRFDSSLLAVLLYQVLLEGIPSSKK
jgi:CDP-diglyceride synthetase